jgi:hypothetical protein
MDFARSPIEPCDQTRFGYESATNLLASMLHIIDWLLADFSVFGVRIQYWMPVFALLFAMFFLFSAWLDRR